MAKIPSNKSATKPAARPADDWDTTPHCPTPGEAARQKQIEGVTAEAIRRANADQIPTEKEIEATVAPLIREFPKGLAASFQLLRESEAVKRGTRADVMRHRTFVDALKKHIASLQSGNIAPTETYNHVLTEYLRSPRQKSLLAADRARLARRVAALKN